MTHLGERTTTHTLWRHVYGALLPMLPRGLRDRQGGAMAELFDRELCRSAPEGVVAICLTGATGVADLVRRGIYERLADERRSLTTTNIATLRRAAAAFLVTGTVLTALFVAKVAVTHAVPARGTVFDIALFSIPFTAAMTIPMSVFIAVLWAATRDSSLRRGRIGTADVRDGTLRLTPVVGMASMVALCCLAWNAELVPRANLKLLTLYAGTAAVTPTDRSMTLGELQRAQSQLVTAGPHASASEAVGASRAGYEVEIQKKLALAAACIALAMLATGIARRAPRLSVWTQAVLSLLVFMGYYVCIIMGEQLADRSAIPPALAMWSANIIVLLLAMLTLRASHGKTAPDVSLPSRAA